MTPPSLSTKTRARFQQPKAATAPLALTLTPEHAEGLAADDRHAWRHDNVGRLTLACYHYFEASMLERLARRGIVDIKKSHLRVFRNIDFDGTRVSEIAARCNVTKGAASQVLADCERLGYVTSSIDVIDARARVITFTAAGQKLMGEFRQAIADVEADFELTIGADDYRQMKLLLKKLRTGLMTR